MITVNGKEYRNLVEQVAKNKEDIQRHYEIERVIADWGIKVIGRLDEWVEPEGVFEYGDAYAVGPEGGPFDFYIWTRSVGEGEGYWLNYGAISIVGPMGPAGPAGPQGEPGTASQWYARPSAPTISNATQNDMFINTSTGDIYQFSNQRWVKMGNIKGIQGPAGPAGADGPIGPAGAPGERGPRGYTTITRIIGELPEGSVIGDTYDPSIQPENATVLMPVNGEPHAWVIIEGLWTDAGPYSGGSSVYVNGEFEQTFDADTKLDKYTGTVYSNGVVLVQKQDGKLSGRGLALPGFESAGNVTVYHTNNLDTTLPNTVLRTGTPKYAAHATNKDYVDNLFVDSETIVLGTTDEGKKTMNLDAEIVNNLSRAILTPMSNPTSTQVPAVTITGAVAYQKYHAMDYKANAANTSIYELIPNNSIVDVYASSAAAYNTGAVLNVFGSNITNVVSFRVIRFETLNYIVSAKVKTTGVAGVVEVISFINTANLTTEQKVLALAAPTVMFRADY